MHDPELERIVQPFLRESLEHVDVGQTARVTNANDEGTRERICEQFCERSCSFGADAYGRP